MFLSLAQVIVTSFLTLPTLLILMALPSYGQSVTDLPISEFKQAGESLTGIALKLAAESHVPFGVEVAADDQNRILDVSHSQDTLGAELDRITSQNLGYSWKISGKAINIFPLSDTDSIFDVKIEHYERKNIDSALMITELLRDPAVLKVLAHQNMTAQLWTTGSSPKNKGSITLKNVTLREALNQILIETHGSAWTAFYVDSDPQVKGSRMMLQVF